MNWKTMSVFVEFLRMVFATEDKAHSKNLYLLKGYEAHTLLAEFTTKNWTLEGIDYLLKKLRQLSWSSAWLTFDQECSNLCLNKGIDQCRSRFRACRRGTSAPKGNILSIFCDCCSSCIATFISCVLFLVESRISEHSVLLIFQKLFNRAHFQALL